MNNDQLNKTLLTIKNYVDTTTMSHFIHTAAVDVDTLKTTGIYSLTSNCTNNATTNAGTMIVDFNVGTPYQLWIPDNTHTFYKRNWDKTNSVWKSWSNKITGSITGNADGNAGTATKLKTARTIAISGDATGSTSFDGSGNVNIEVSIDGAGNAGSANKVNNPLTVQLNSGTTEGTNKFTFDGSAAKSVNITPGGIGAYTKSEVDTKLGGKSNTDHTHDDRYFTETEVTTKLSELSSSIDTKLEGKADSSHGTHVTWSTTTPKANGTASVGTESKVARGDHVHPLQTTVSGNAGTATKFQTAQSVTLSGDVIGTASSQAGWSVETELATTGVTAGSYGPSADATPGYGSTFNVPYIAVDEKGRITSASTKTVKIPASDNSDTKVKSTLSTSTKFHLTGTTATATTTGEQYFDTGVYVSTNAGELVATKFKGALEGNVTGNLTGTATNATQAEQDSAGQEISTTYIKGLSVSGKTITYTKGDGTTGTITTQDTNTDTKVTNTLATTTKAYVTGTTSATTSTGTQVFDTGVYLDTTAGQLTATKFKGSLEGNVTGNVTGSSGSCTGNAASADKVNSSLKIQLNGGTTEGSNQYTFNGSGAKTVNITPSSIGAAASSHGTHVDYATTAPKANGTAAVGTSSKVAREDHVHPLQTTVSGNAGSADKLKTARTISLAGDATGEATFDGTEDVQITVAVANDSHTHKSMEVKGTNTISSTTNDTTANWGAQKNSVHWYSTTGQLTDQPSQYGLLYNITNGSSEVHQLWLTQASGDMKHRGGNASGWSGTWRTLLDTSNFKTHVTPSAIGAATSGHTHNYAGSSSAGGAATSANKVNSSLKVQLNGGTTEGTSQFTFDGSSAKTISITPAGIGAATSGHTHDDRYYTETEINNKINTINSTASSNLAAAKAYADEKIAALVDSAPDAMNTLNELAEAISSHQSVYDSYVTTVTNALAGKAPTSHASTSTTYGEASETKYGHAMASSTTPKANGTAAVGSETAKFARGDHVHPLQTTVSGNAGSADKVNQSLKIQLNGGTTEGTNQFTFNGSTAKTISITPTGIGASKGSSISATTAATKQWYRIAQTKVDIDNAIGLFVIRGAVSSYHSSTILTAGITYGKNPTLNQLAHTNYGSGLTQARIVYNATYSGAYAYLEVYLNQAAATTISVDLYSNLGWTLVTPSTVGSIPTNYTSSSITFAVNKIVSNINGSLSGNASTATKLKTARTIALTGDVTGSASFNGETDISIDAVIADNSHSHSNYLPLAGGTVTGDLILSNKGIQTTKAYTGETTYTATPLGISYFTTNDTDNGAASTYSTTLTVNQSSSRQFQICANTNGEVLAFRSAHVNNTGGTGEGWCAWNKIYHEGNKPTAFEIGAADRSHTHNYAGSSSAGGAADSVANSLKIQLNGGTTEGTNQYTFNGSGAKTVNITPSSIGAAASSHGTHVTYATNAPKANGTAAVGTVNRVAREDHVHPLQTTVSGNAGSADKLKTARTIALTGDVTGSASFNGETDISIDAVIADGSHNHSAGNITSGTLSADRLATSGVTAGNYGPSAAASPAFGGTFSVPYITVDNKGRVTSASSKTITVPSLGSTSTTAYRGDHGLAAYNHSQAEHAPSNAQKNSDITKAEIEAKLTGVITTHTHSYLPLSGGTVTGDLILSNKGIQTTKAYDGTTAYNATPLGISYTQTGDTDNGTASTYSATLTVNQSANRQFQICINNTASTFAFRAGHTNNTDGTGEGWTAWNKIYHEGNKPTAFEIGAAAASHTHNYAGSSSAGGAANSVKTNLVIKLNSGSTEGTNLFTFNGSTAKTINITPSAIGAAAAEHGTHLTLGTGSGNAYRGDHGLIAYNHSQSAHAPSNAQKNSDITKAEIEAKLTGTITSHSHITDSELTTSLTNAFGASYIPA